MAGNKSRNVILSAASTSLVLHPAPQFTKARPSRPSLILRLGLWSSCAGQRAIQPLPHRRALSRATRFSTGVLIDRSFHCRSDPRCDHAAVQKTNMAVPAVLLRTRWNDRFRSVAVFGAPSHKDGVSLFCLSLVATFFLRRGHLLLWIVFRCATEESLNLGMRNHHSYPVGNRLNPSAIDCPIGECR